MPVMTGKAKTQVDEETLTLKKKELKAKLDDWLKRTLNNGFEHGGYIWQADEQAQSLALATLVLSQSDPSVFPREWRNKANEMILFNSTAEFGPFAMAMKSFVDQTYGTVFLKKDAVVSATSLAELENIQI